MRLLLKDVTADKVADGVRAAAKGESPATRAPRAPSSPRSRSPIPPDLSARGSRLLVLLVEGLPNKLVARQAGVSEKTVETHPTSVFRHSE